MSDDAAETPAPAAAADDAAADDAAADDAAADDAAADDAAAAAAERSDGTLAAALGRLACTVWPTLDADARHAAADAVGTFVAAPGPARFLAAARQLSSLRRARRAAELSAALAERVFARGVARLTEVPFVPAETRALLVDQPHDGAAGRRLWALATLLEAHAELAARVRSADAGHVALQRERRQ
jgi:hypothetical protein